ncbi:CDP-alcohol phosphatidyltransferase family protein [Pinisolibacter sp.]|uniref:CDP-alcohol phosphatidyltransferase family protein n=1 Tax=Pinisolibacter sp. TaxID=2172024 RepID=UPI002FDD5CD0
MDACPPPFLSLVGENLRTRWTVKMWTAWGYVLFYRPLSLAIAWGLAFTSLSPTSVTLIGGLSIPAMVAAVVLLPVEVAMPVIGLAAYLGGLFDCVDGDLARITGRTSRFGGYIDFQIDVVRWAVFYVTAGIAADEAAGDEHTWTTVAATAAWLKVFARGARDYRISKLGRDPDTTESRGVNRTFAGVIVAFFSGIDGSLPILVVAGWWAGVGGWALIVPLVLSIADAVETQYANIVRYRRADREA